MTSTEALTIAPIRHREAMQITAAGERRIRSSPA